MNLQDARALAELILESHGLDKEGWTFEWHSKKRVNGNCNYPNKVISLGVSYANLNAEVYVENTLLHEAAHALVGPGHGHGPVWFAKAQSIGCTGSRRSSPDTVKPKGKYSLVCPSCEKTSDMHAKPRVARSCGNCSPRRFNPQFLMKVVKNF